MSMASSFISASRFQPVFAPFLIAVYFITGGFSGRDYTDYVAATLSIGYYTYQAVYSANCRPTFLTVIFPAIRQSQYRTVKHIFHIGKVDSMFANIVLVLCLIPFKTYTCSADVTYTNIITVFSRLVTLLFRVRYIMINPDYLINIET